MAHSLGSRRGQYKNYDPELKRAVMKTGNIKLAVNRGVCRTTAISWMTTTKSIPEDSCASIEILNEELESLQEQLITERSKVHFLSSLNQYLHIIHNGKRKISKTIKKIFVNKINQYLKHCSLKELLALIKLGNSRFQRWRSEVHRCEITKKFECGIRRSNQLTGDEVVKIRTLAIDKKYFHFSLTSLWKFAYRNNLVVCSRDVWFKYINLYDLKRLIPKGPKNIFKLGVRANKANEIWHLDLSVIVLANGKKVYFQAIIDNYSRYIVNWKLSENKSAKYTRELILKSKSKLKNNLFNTDIYMDNPRLQERWPVL
jgi:putative transposase